MVCVTSTVKESHTQNTGKTTRGIGHHRLRRYRRIQAIYGLVEGAVRPGSWSQEVAMFQLMVLIALVCVPILSLLAIKASREQKERKKAQAMQENAALKGLYERQL